MLGSSDTLARAVDAGKQISAARVLRIVLSGHGRFVVGSYAGSHSGGLTLAMTLVRVRAGTKVENVFPGEP